MKEEGLPLVIFGTGDTAREAAYLIKEINNALPWPAYRVLGYIGAEEEEQGNLIGEYSVVSVDADFSDFSQRFSQLAVVIPMADGRVKKKIYEKIKNKQNLIYPNLIHPSLNLREAKLGFGNLLQADVTISIQVEMGNFNFINYQTFVGHDVKIGNFCVCSPHSTLCGHVRLEDQVFVGASATILQGLSLCSETVIGAGALLTKDINSSGVWMGVPACPKEV